MTNSIESGITFGEFHQRLVEIVSLAQESLLELQDKHTKELVLDFVTSLQDAHGIWSCKMQFKDPYLKYFKFSASTYRYSGYLQLDSRWKNDLSILIERYDLELEPATPGRFWLYLDQTIKKVLSHSATAFSKLAVENQSAQ